MLREVISGLVDELGPLRVSADHIGMPAAHLPAIAATHIIDAGGRTQPQHPSIALHPLLGDDLQVSLLRDPDFDYTEDFRGFLELFATERAVRFGAAESDAQGHYAQVEVFAGETPVAKVFVGGFLERWPDQAYAWAMWRFGVDPGQMGEFLEQLLPEE